MKSTFENSVIIIGGDHHNTLSVVRCLSKQKVSIHVLIHCNSSTLDDIRLASSKYVRGKIETIQANSAAILDRLLAFSDCGVKSMLFPCSDLAEYTIDTNYSLLAKKFFLPGFTDQPGRVCNLMDKFNQKKFADQNGIRMAETWSVDLSDDAVSVPSNICFPCIAKPEISATGSKSDIAISQSEDELLDVLKRFAEKGYQKVLLQRFVKKKYEICAHGAVISQSPYFCWGIMKRLNEYPSGGLGGTCYAQFIHEREIRSTVEKILKRLHQEGYRGMFDIEFFVCEDEIYLNEINFRHSGNGYALIKNKVYAPYYWCADAIGVQLNSQNEFFVDNESFHMNEIYEWRLFKSGGISIKKFLLSCMKSKAYAFFDLRDMSGTYGFYKGFFHTIRQKIIG